MGDAKKHNTFKSILVEFEVVECVEVFNQVLYISCSLFLQLSEALCKQNPWTRMVPPHLRVKILQCVIAVSCV